MSQLSAEVPDKDKTLIQGFLHYAKQHQQIIEEFGRYPHRNLVLERQSTGAESLYLKKFNSGFGQ